MTHRKLILNAAVVLVVFGLLVYFGRPKRPAAVPSPAPAAQFPAQPAPPVKPPEPLPKEWDCPADPGKWFKAGGGEVIETEKRWNKYLKVSGFQPPGPVDFELYRAALFTFRGGGPRPRFEAARADGRYNLTMITSTRTGEAAGKDAPYDCRLFLVPSEAGELVLDFKNVPDSSSPDRSLVMPLPYDPEEKTATLPDDGDKPISLDKPVSVPGSGEPPVKKPVRPASAPPPL